MRVMDSFVRPHGTGQSRILYEDDSLAWLRQEKPRPWVVSATYWLLAAMALYLMSAIAFLLLTGGMDSLFPHK
jgi:hypothetical protein